MENGRLPDAPLTADDITSWLGVLGDQGQLAIGSLRAYVSALHTWYEEGRHPDSFAPNPAKSMVVRRVLDGIERDRAQRMQARPLASPDAGGKPLLFTTLQKLHFNPNSARDRMLQAAAFLGVAAGLRPSELLGSSHARDRALLREQITFFSDDAGTVHLASPRSGESPRVLELTLRVTKTSQLLPVVKLVRAPDAIVAVWRWFQETAERGPRARLFQSQENGDSLSTFALTQDLQRRHAAAGLGSIRLTGKSWRRGGASTLAMQGFEAADIAALGWKADSSMWERYARDPLVRRQRAIARGDLMQQRPQAEGRVRSDVAVAVDRRS